MVQSEDLTTEQMTQTTGITTTPVVTTVPVKTLKTASMSSVSTEVTTGSSEMRKQMTTNGSNPSEVPYELSDPSTTIMNPSKTTSSETEVEASTKATSLATMPLIESTEQITSSSAALSSTTFPVSKTKSLATEITYSLHDIYTTNHVVTTSSDERSSSNAVSSTVSTLIEDTSVSTTTPSVTIETIPQQDKTMSSSLVTQSSSRLFNIDSTTMAATRLELSGDGNVDDEDLVTIESSGHVDSTTNKVPLTHIYTTPQSTPTTRLDVTSTSPPREDDTTHIIIQTTTDRSPITTTITTNEPDTSAPFTAEVINKKTTESATSTSTSSLLTSRMSNTTQLDFEPTSTSAITSNSTTYSTSTNSPTHSTTDTVGIPVTTTAPNVTASTLKVIDARIASNTTLSSPLTTIKHGDNVDDSDFTSSGDGASGDGDVTAECMFGYVGVNCTVYTICPGSTNNTQCSGHGECYPPKSCHLWSASNGTANVTSDCQGSCTCNEGFSGKDCGMRFDPLVPDMVDSKCPVDCGEHGSCEMYNETSFKCMCAEGYFGLNCEYEDEVEEPYYPTTSPLFNSTHVQSALNSTDSQVQTTRQTPTMEKVTIDNDRLVSNVTVFIRKVYLNPKQEIMNELRSIVNDLYMMDDLLKVYGVRLVDFNAATLKTITVNQKLTEAPSLVFEWSPDNNTVIIDDSAPKPQSLRVEIPRIWQIEMMLSLDTPFWTNLTTVETSEAYWRFYKMIELFSRSTDYRIMFGLPPAAVEPDSANDVLIGTTDALLGSTATSSVSTTPGLLETAAFTPLPTTAASPNVTSIASTNGTTHVTTEVEQTPSTTILPSTITTTVVTTTAVSEPTNTPRVEKPVIEFESSVASRDYEMVNGDDVDLVVTEHSTPPPTKQNTSTSMIDDIVICEQVINGTKITWPTDWRGECDVDDYEDVPVYDRGDAVANFITSDPDSSSSDSELENESLPARGDPVNLLEQEKGAVPMTMKEKKIMEVLDKMVPHEETTTNRPETIEVELGSGWGETDCDDDDICAMKAKPMATMLPPHVRPEIVFDVNGFKRMKIDIAFDIESEM